MIRDFRGQDMDNVKKILQKGFQFEKRHINEISEDENKTLLVFDDGEIKGFAYLKTVNSEEKNYRITVFVDPEWRRNGIGTALYNSITTKLKELKPNVLTTYFNVTEEDPNEFYRKLGFKKWWGHHEAYYNKQEPQPEVDLTFVPYEDKYFDTYLKLIQHCFYELRKENDIKPYIAPFSEKDRESFDKIKKFINLTFKDGELIAAAHVQDGYINTIVVSPSHQGKGLGKKVTHFAMNKALNQNTESIHLSVLCWNKKAIKLYEKLGFKITQTVHYYRQFCDIEF